MILGNKVFRKVSLDRLSSPEQLDQMIRVTSPLGWTALLAIGLLLAGLLAWGVTGSIPTTINGGGILIKTGGLVNVVAPVGGQISHIYVEEGDQIRKGQIVGRMSQPKLSDSIKATREELASLEQREQQMALFGSQELELELLSVNK